MRVEMCFGNHFHFLLLAIPFVYLVGALCFKLSSYLHIKIHHIAIYDDILKQLRHCITGFRVVDLIFHSSLFEAHHE